MVKSRRNPSARTNLQEVIDSGVVVALAPTKLLEEVNKHIPRLAAERDISEEHLRREWQQYQSRIQFYEVNTAGLDAGEVADPDDLPFVYLYQKINADAIMTRDKHISMMGARSVKLEAVVHIRDYARDKTPEVTIRFGTTAISELLVGGTVAMAKLSSKAVKGFSKLPSWLQIALLIGAVAAGIHPRSRRSLSAFFSSSATKLKSPGGVLLNVFDTLIRELNAAELKVESSQRLLRAIPRASKRPLKVMAEEACAQAITPVTLDELAKGILRAGYEPRSSEFKRYLLRVLRQNDQFVNTADGRWTLRRDEDITVVG